MHLVLLFAATIISVHALRCYTCTGRQGCQWPVIEVCPPSTYCYYAEDGERLIQKGCVTHCSSINVPHHQCHMCYTDACNSAQDQNFNGERYKWPDLNQNIGSGVNIDREIDDSLDIGQGTNTNDESASMNGMLDIGQGANAHRRSDIGQGAYYNKERVDRRINQNQPPNIGHGTALKSHRNADDRHRPFHE